MLFRFSLYGFLKNLRLFEAFLVLALLERGLDFFAIGGLIAVREIMINLCEIPSGALADGIGRKRRHGAEAEAATTLSIEAQGKALRAAILAPAIGALIDHLAAGAEPVPAAALWPVALLGLPLLGLLFWNRRPGESAWRQCCSL